MAPQRLFRFGASVSAVPSRAAWIHQVQKVEAQGYATLLLPDHFEAHWFPPLTALMAAADATTQLRVGTFVLDNDYRHPAVLAREAATLDLLSEGRFELGIGAGWLEPDYQQSGIPFDLPGVRVSRVEEALHILKRFFTEDYVTFHGRHYTLNNLVSAPKPVQRPHPPLLIAGAGRRMLSLAAREADIVGLLVKTAGSRVNLADGSAAATEQRIEWIKAAAGDRFSALELNTLVYNVVVTDNGRRVADELAVAWGCTPEQLLDTIYVLVGSIEHISEQIQMWRERFGVSYIAIPGEENIETLAPVVARLAGT
jgi:probable F420-dependent oxidoreductase